MIDLRVINVFTKTICTLSECGEVCDRRFEKIADALDIPQRLRHDACPRKWVSAFCCEALGVQLSDYADEIIDKAINNFAKMYNDGKEIKEDEILKLFEE